MSIADKTVAEAIDAKWRAERSIQDLLNAYCQAYGLRVVAIDVDVRAEKDISEDFPDPIWQVRIQVKL